MPLRAASAPLRTLSLTVVLCSAACEEGETRPDPEPLILDADGPRGPDEIVDRFDDFDTGTSMDDDGGRSAMRDAAVSIDTDAAMQTDGGEGGDAGAGNLDGPCVFDASKPSKTMVVPSSGGDLEICTLSGGHLVLTFPASTAGATVTATVMEPLDSRWNDLGLTGALRDVVDITPHSLVLTDPIMVRLPFATVLGFVLGDASDVPLPLRRSANPQKLVMGSMGVLGVLGRDSCRVEPGAAFTSPWNDNLQGGMCSAYFRAGLSTYREYVCQGAAFCSSLRFGCCISPDTPPGECTSADPFWFQTYQRANTNPAYPYCDGVGDTGFVTSTTPSSLLANGTTQEVTLHGTNFRAGGYARWNGGASSSVIDTYWVSSTEVRVKIAGNVLGKAGAATIGYATSTPANSWAGWASNDFPISIVAE